MAKKNKSKHRAKKIKKIKSAQATAAKPFSQKKFDKTIGKLDRILSKMIEYSGTLEALDEPNIQTLKHHAEDMVGAGEKVLRNITANSKALD